MSGANLPETGQVDRRDKKKTWTSEPRTMAWALRKEHGMQKEERWPAAPGLMMDLPQVASSTSVMDDEYWTKAEGLEDYTVVCTVRAVGIAQDTTVVVKSVGAQGVLSDSGANLCMADSETHLVKCHDITPVLVGFALA